jgi:pentatricopeptide repeat protein
MIFLVGSLRLTDSFVQQDFPLLISHTPCRFSSTCITRHVLKEPSSRQAAAWSGEDQILKFNQKKSSSRPLSPRPPRWTSKSEEKRNDVSFHNQWKKAEQIESKMLNALELMKEQTSARPRFPAVRECNAALATFADGGDFLRALGLFLKMRKASTMTQSLKDGAAVFNVPAPTLVTYCTLMSRAVQVGKEGLALRLWYLMKTQAEFFSSHSKTPVIEVILPDVKAANILMNVHAKLCDVESAQYLMSQMTYGNGTDVPLLQPNLVTYNTLLDACHKAGDLDAALEAKKQLDESGLIPDARTYTTLIATVGRKTSSASGARDPSMAFAFLDEMLSLNVQPNGMTYSALIDACARCGRTDMALKGLSTMLRQKAVEVRALNVDRKTHTLYQEVGAWTAAINAMGKAGRVETALRLFQAMPKNGLQPNAVTCGCIADCLLRHGRIADTLYVLNYMKKNGIVPSEVMYTSLMTSAGRLAEIENKQKWNGPTGIEDGALFGDGNAKAIEVYTALIKTVTEEVAAKDDENKQLMKVFLVFQEMRAAGAEPDLACYNALLRACSRAGDVRRATDVLRRIIDDDLVPNETSWREAIKAAAKARSSYLAEQIWRQGVEFHAHKQTSDKWMPSMDSFTALVSAYLREASDYSASMEKRCELYKKVISMYRDSMAGSERRKVEKMALLASPRALGMILQAIISLDQLEESDKHKDILRRVASSIVTLEVWRGLGLIDTRTLKALETAQRWSDRQ